MHTFKFRAKKSNGQLLSGKIKAKSKNEVLYLLNAKKLEPINIELQKKLFTGGGGISGVSSKHLVTFTRQLAFLIDAGVPVVQALRIVSEISQHPVLRTVIEDIVNGIESGNTFSTALSAHPAIFGNIYVSIIEAGETGGSLDIMLNRLAGYIEESERLKERVKKAMMYPSFVLSIGLAIVVVIMVVVVPKFVGIFDSSDMKLPAVTQLLISTSDFFKNNLLLIIVSGVVIPFAFIMYLRTASARPLKDQLLMMIPIIGSLAVKSGLARFSRTLSCLLSGGVNLAEALGTSALTSNNFFIERAIKNVQNQVIKGKSIAQSMKKEKVIPPLIANMVAIGEETGKTDATLEKVAEFYEEQVKTTTNTISDLIQPFLIAVLGGLVGFIVIALYLPIFKMPGVVGGA